MTTEHRFLIGSVTKTFVAAVVLQLVGEGALALDDEVGPIAEGVTLRQLLNHTSGLPEYYADFDSLIAPYRADRGYKPNLTPRAALELVHAKPRLFPPGAAWEYSGGNYLALGLIVEETTGATLREELRRRIIEPLGLDGTDLRDRLVLRAAISCRGIRSSRRRRGTRRRDRRGAVRLGLRRDGLDRTRRRTLPAGAARRRAPYAECEPSC